MEKKRPKPADGSNPFEGMKMASHDALAAIKGRSKCSRCGSSRKYFCYSSTCYIPVPDLEGKLPVVKLPVKVDIIKHSREVDGKSTAIHAAVLAPHDVNMYTYPAIPNYDDLSEKVVLVYPSKDSVSLEELTLEQSQAEIDGNTEAVDHPFHRVIFIDCTWNQTNQIYRDERLRSLQCVRIQNRKTCFWRGQQKDDSYLATIEAIYYFMVDYHRTFLGKENNGYYDNLLYFYSFMFDLVHQDHRENLKKKKEDNG